VTLRPTSDEEGATSAAPSREETPFQGKYRLLGELGRGGVGLVLQARDVDLGREVAIKVLRDEYQRRPEIVRRFVEEAQIGGQLQHPGVVPVYDLGLQEGRPFFAMKLIRGKSLAELLEARDDVKADRRRFLGIFEQIAQTLAYAHARGVIHRDLKPANVMVGAFGEVQVVDWGMGKVLGGDDTPEEPLPADVPVEPASEEGDRPDLRSTLGSAMGTPGYMPPEQARGALGEIDTRSDVFALGAILLEILTGQPAQGGTPMERLVKALRADPRDWQDRLAGAEADEDLVALVSSCLSADRDARPASAREVAERVTSYLSAVEERARRALLDAARARTEAAEAQAREAQSRARAAQEQARAEREEAAAEQARLRADAERRRRRATVAIAVVLLVGVVGTLWSLVQANEQRRIADEARAAEAKRAEGERLANEKANRRLAQVQQANDLLGSIFQSLTPEEIASDEVPLQQVLATKLEATAKKLEGDAFEDPVVAGGMQIRLGSALASLGRPERGIPLLEAAVDRYRKHFGPDGDETLSALGELGGVLLTAEQLPRALEVCREAVDLTDARAPTDPARVRCRAHLGMVLQEAGRPTEALPYLEEALAAFRKDPGPDDYGTLAVQSSLATCYAALDRVPEALPLLEQVAKVLRARYGVRNPATLHALDVLANVLRVDHRPNDARKLSEEAFREALALFGPGHPITKRVMHTLALLRRETGDAAGAHALITTEYERLKATYGPGDARTISAMNNLGASFWSNGQYDQAVSVLEEAVKLAEASLGNDASTTEIARCNLGTNYYFVGRKKEALPLLTEVLENPAAPVSTVSQAVHTLMQILMPRGQVASLLPRIDAVVDRLRKATGGKGSDVMEVLEVAGTACQDASRFDQAVRYFEEYRKLATERRGENSVQVFRALCDIAACHSAAGRPDDARRSYEEALKRYEADAEHAGYDEPDVQSRLALCYLNLGKGNEAIPCLRRVLEALPPTPGESTAARAHAGTLLAAALARHDQYAEAAKVLQKVLALDTAREGPTAPDTVFTTSSLAMCLEHIGQKEEAHALFEQAAKSYAARSDDPAYGTLMAANRLAICFLHLDRLEEAARFTRIEIKQYEDPKLLGDALNRFEGVGVKYLERKQYDRAAEILGELLKDRERLEPENVPAIVFTLLNLAIDERNAGLMTDALGHDREAARRYDAAPDRPEYRTTRAANLLAGCFQDLHRWDDAIRFRTAGLEDQVKENGWRDTTTLHMAETLAEYYAQKGNLEEAASRLEKVVETWIEVAPPDDLLMLRARAELGTMLLGLNRPKEALPHLETAVTLGGEDPVIHRWLKAYLGAVLATRGSEKKAIEIVRKEIGHPRGDAPQEQIELASLQVMLAQFLLRTGEAEDAEAAARAALAIREKLLPDSWALPSARACVGRALLEEKRPKEAEPILRAAAEGLLAKESSMPPLAKPRITETIQALVDCYVALDRKDDADTWRARLAAREK
jgi:tetratricopeptide (TPR) repeat protein/predicted Ser/Thr protein kinase